MSFIHLDTETGEAEDEFVDETLAQDISLYDLVK